MKEVTQDGSLNHWAQRIDRQKVRLDVKETQGGWLGILGTKDSLFERVYVKELSAKFISRRH